MPKLSKLTEDDKEEIVFFYRDEWLTYDALAEIYGVSGGCIRDILLAKGVPLRGRGYHAGRHFSSAEINDIVTSYAEGKSVRELANVYGCNITTISKTLRNNGVYILTGAERKLAKIDEEAVIRLYRDGVTAAQIIKTHHLSLLVLRRLVKKHGLTYRKTVDYLSPRFTEDEIFDMVDRYTSRKESIAKIAAAYKADESTVGVYLKEAGVRVEAYARFRPDEQEEKQIVEAYVKGEKLMDIARRFNRRFGTAREIVTRYGVSIRSHIQTASKSFGYIGYYKHYLFRSLMELSFILDHEDDHTIESAEQSHRLDYYFNGKKCRYYPDFILDGKVIVEIKPKHNWEDPKVVAKADAMHSFCTKNQMEYRLTDWPYDKSKIWALVKDGTVRIINRSPEVVAKYLDVS